MRNLVRILIGAVIGAGLAFGFTALAGKPMNAGEPLATMLAVVGALIGLGASVLVGSPPSGDNAADHGGEAP